MAFAVASQTYGQVWTQTGAAPGNWLLLAGSADGTKLAAVNGTHIYTSSDSGADWFATTAPAKSWRTLASSADGNVLLAAAVSSGGVYSSTNSGNTWQSNSLPTYPVWDTAAVSSNGNTMVVAGTVSGSVYYSTNWGANWNSNGTPSGYWTSVVCTSDGSKLAAVWAGALYVSTNSGVNWINYNSSSGDHLACSADGSRLLLWSLSPSRIWISTNWGATLTAATLPVSNLGLLLVGSADLKRVVGMLDGQLYLSTNYCASWTTNYAPPKNWASMALSADGTQMVASTTSSDGVYAWRPPVLSFSSSSGSLGLSWSTNGTPFGLQVNSDLASNGIAVTNSSTISNSQMQVVIPQDQGAGFFRLVSQ